MSGVMEKDSPAPLLQIALIGLFVLALLYTLYLARALVLPVFLAIFLSLILRPLVRALKHLGIPQRLSAFGILLGFFVLLSGAATLLYDPATS